MDESKRQHLEFIQNVITRMNTNSFQIKGMAITIVSALLAIYASTANIVFIFLSIAPTILFWFLDSYYLQLEHKYRKLYENVCGLKNDKEIKQYDLSIKDFKCCFCKIFFSETIALLYGTIVSLLLLCGLIIKYKDCIIIINCK